MKFPGEVFMRRSLGIQVLGSFIALFAFLPAHGQNTPLLDQQPSAPSLERKIELLIRSQFSVAPQYDMIFGTRRKSSTTGYDILPVTFVSGSKQTAVDFLISEDGSTLARLETFDLSTNPALSIQTSDRPMRGEPTARVEIINFDDLQCPYCGMLNSEILPATLKHYHGLIKVVYKDYPLPGHPWAQHAAIDANCLATQNSSAYWSYVDYVHQHGQEISGANYSPARSFSDLDNIAETFATQSHLDETSLTICLKKQDSTVINQSLKLGSSLGLTGTPQVFVDGERLPSGARPVEELWPAIDRALKAKGIQLPAGKESKTEAP
jgi:protein-disulfide isomerase